MIRIILVVDDPNSARDIQNRLQRVNCDVIATTATADEVITRADELRPDVILMDVRLKEETDGVEVAQQIKSLHDIPIIFITANADEATVRRAIAAEPDGFLIMPFDALELRATIELAIHRHGTEAMERESDRRINELTESLPEVIFETDTAGNITFVNHAGLKEFGYVKEQVEGGMTLYDFVPPDKREEIRESIAQAVIDEPSEWIEVPGLRRDGSTFPVSVRASLIVREGIPVGIRGIALNVTEQKRAEQQREDSERQLRELTDLLPEIVFETDVGGTFTFLNHIGLESLGYTEADLKKQLTIEDVIIPADLARARENFRKRLGGAAAVWAEYTVQRKDRSTFPLSIRTTAVIRDGVVVGARGIAVDIAEQKRAEAVLIKSERHIREITDTLPVVVYEADETGRFTFANATAFDMFGYTKGELEAGMSILQVVIDADEERARTMFSLRMGEDDVGRVEYTGRRKDGSTFPISVRGAPIRRDGAVVGVRGIIVDITERKQAEEKVKEYTHTIEILNHIVTEGNRATDVQSFAEAATKLACELMHFDIGGIYLIDTDARYATLRYAQGLPKTARDAIKKIPYHDAPYNAILIDGNPLFAEDYVSFLPQHAPLGAASLASVPLYSQDTIVGALNVGSATRYTFSQAEKELLIAIGSEAGTVIAKLQADDALKESEKRIREITDALPVVVYETDATNRLTFVNATSSDLFGYTKEELEAGMSIFQLIATADKERAHAVFRRRMGGEDVGRIEYAGLRKDGSTFPVSIRAVLIRRDGAVVGMRGIIVDITERKQAEEKVKEHTRTIEMLNLVMTEGNRAASVESFAETVTNLTLEFMHFDAGTIHLGDDDARYANLRYATGIPDTAPKAIREIPLDEPPYVGFLVAPKPLFLDGHEVSRVPHVAELGLKSLAVVPLYRYDEVIGALNVGSFKRHTFSQTEKELLIAIGSEAETVIAKLQADDALKESEKRIREITDTLPVVVYEADETGRFTFANATAFDMFGYTKGELEAEMTVFQVVIDADKERARTAFRRRGSGDDVGRVEYTGLRKDGSTFPFSNRGAAIRRDGAIVGVRGIAVDITERKQAEQALARESAINSAIARLFTPLIAPTSTLEDIALAILDEAKHLTGSEAGFVGLIDPTNRDMIGFGLTQMMAEEGAIPEEKRQIRFPIGPDGSYPSLWGHALTSKKAFYTNAPATHPASRGTPDGHTPLEQLLAAPALVGEDVVGQTVLANPGRDYTERDLKAVERLADVYALAVVRTREEEAIKTALKERETLLKEIHHRVKNNMQIVSSLLSLQAAQATERETIEMLNESQRRIRSMALIHERLYLSGSLAEIDFADYVESLIDELLQIYKVPLGVITITADIENVQLGVDTAIPCALIINELMSNSLKYGFPGGRAGDVTVALHRANGAYTLTVADNGVGFPADLDFRATDTLGMQLVVTLVNQLNGTITLDHTKGTTFIITFKLAGARIEKSGGK